MKKSLPIIALLLSLILNTADAINTSPKSYSRQITVCTINKQVKNNPAYFHIPITATRLKCDNFKSSPTITDLYSQGWRLIQAVNIDNRLATKANEVPSSLLYFEK